MGGTASGKALEACREVLTSRQEGDRMIILVTDGMSFDMLNGGGIPDLAFASSGSDSLGVFCHYVADYLRVSSLRTARWTFRPGVE